MVEENNEICEHCGAKLKAYWVALTPGLVSALVKFRAGTVVKRRNKIHLLKDLNGTDQELTRHEWNNFTRLRFHGLAVKYKDASGYWLLTKRGADFLNGLIKVPKRVKIFRNKIIERSLDEVFVGELVGKVPYFEKIDDIEYEAVGVQIPESPKPPERKQGHWDFSTGSAVWVK